jgi:hypothetical protein
MFLAPSDVAQPLRSLTAVATRFTWNRGDTSSKSITSGGTFLEKAVTKENFDEVGANIQRERMVA